MENEGNYFDKNLLEFLQQQKGHQDEVEEEKDRNDHINQIFAQLSVCVCVCLLGTRPQYEGALYSDEGQIMMYLSTKTQIQ